MSLARAPLRLAIAATLVLQPVLAHAKVLEGKSSTDWNDWEVFYAGDSGASSIVGSEDDDVIFGDPASGQGSPTALKRLVMGRDANGNVVEPDAYVAISSQGEGAVSPDGKWVLVQSPATNLVPGFDTGGKRQIYRANIETGEVLPISTTPQGLAGTGDSSDARFSPDGRHVVFWSDAANIGAGSIGQIFVKTIATGQITRVSGMRGSGLASALGSNARPAFASDGLIFFVSQSNNLGLGLDGDTDGGARDLYAARFIPGASIDSSSTATLVSTRSDGTDPSSANSGFAISPGGNAVIFGSEDATMLNTVDANTGVDVFVRRINQNTLTDASRVVNPSGEPVWMVSVANAGAQGVGCDSEAPSFHPNGKWIVFATKCSTLGGPDGNGLSDIYLKKPSYQTAERTNGEALPMSLLSNGSITGNGESTLPLISPDGRRVAFLTKATNLDPDMGTNSGKRQLVIRDIASGSTPYLVSRVEKGGDEGDEMVDSDIDGRAFAFLPDGTGLVFETLAKNLVSPAATFGNVYLATLPSATGAPDLVDGRGGDDRIYGGPGSDIMVGGSGNDLLFGGDGDDRFGDAYLATENSQIIAGPEGSDFIDGGSGLDIVYLLGDRQRYRIEPTLNGDFEVTDLSATSLFEIHHLRNIESVVMRNFDDATGTTSYENYPLDASITASNNHPPKAIPTILSVRAGGVVTSSALASDAEGDAMTAAIVAAPKKGTASVASGGRVTYRPTAAGATADTFTVRVSDPWGGSVDVPVAVAIGLKLVGNGGSNVLKGKGGPDVLIGKAGADRLVGNVGDDRLDGGKSSDRMLGGKGNDTYVVDAAGDRVIEKAGEGTDTVISKRSYILPANVENLVLSGRKTLAGTGNALANRITGNRAANILKGKGGKDVLAGRGGRDRLDGGKGTDTADYSASPKAVTVSLATGRGQGGDAAGDRLVSIENLLGSRFADRLTGDDRVNVLDGGAGDDVLDGGKGADRLTGGAGKDTFRFRAVTDSVPGARDVILDFSGADGDVVDLSAIDADSKKAGNQPFLSLGNTAFTGVAGEVVFELDDQNTQLRLTADTNGDKTADFELFIAVKDTIAETNFKGITFTP